MSDFKPYVPTLAVAHTETIICNECHTKQVAEVWRTDTFNVYIHICNHCGDWIMESEWQGVSDA